MSDLEALEITYNMAVKYSKGPLTDEEMDALLKVRAMILRGQPDDWHPERDRRVAQEMAECFPKGE